MAPHVMSCHFILFHIMYFILQFQQFLMKVAGEEGVTGFMLRSALSAKLQNLRLKGITKHSVWDRLIFSKAKNAMGMKNVRLMISGGAPLPTQTMEVRTILYFSFFL